MKLKFGSAKHDENGRYENGRRGEQDPTEVAFDDFYIHSKGWYRLRAKDPAMRQKLSYAMAAACNNSYFGYSQNDRDSGFESAKKVGFDPAKVSVPVNVDCSRLVGICCNYAGIKVGDFYTGNEVDILEATGKFFAPISVSSIIDCADGDILVTKTKGHTVICIDDTSKEQTPKIPVSTDSTYKIRIIGTSELNIRNTPGTTGCIIGSYKTSDRIEISAKTIIDGTRWFQTPKGWISGNYIYGWIKEANKWWYLKQGGKYPTNVIETINGKKYAFDWDGWMIEASRINSDGSIKQE